MHEYRFRRGPSMVVLSSRRSFSGGDGRHPLGVVSSGLSERFAWIEDTIDRCLDSDVTCDASHLTFEPQAVAVDPVVGAFLHVGGVFSHDLELVGECIDRYLFSGKDRVRAVVYTFIRENRRSDTLRTEARTRRTCPRITAAEGRNRVHCLTTSMLLAGGQEEMEYEAARAQLSAPLVRLLDRGKSDNRKLRRKLSRITSGVRIPGTFARRSGECRS